MSVAPHPGGAVVGLERCDQSHRPAVLLGLYGAELLGAFLLAARLSLPEPMPDEASGGPFPARFHLVCGPRARIVIEQDEAFPLTIEAPLWDRLYAELCLALAHGRDLARRAGASVH